MFKKSLSVFIALFAFAAASFAAETVVLDLNYWCRGNLKLLNELPEGVKMGARRNYSQKKFAHICLYTVTVDVSKEREFELELEVVDTGDKESAKLNPSLSPSKGLVADCLEFEVDGKPAIRQPRKITKWTSMSSVTVKKGQKITIKCKIRKGAAAPAAAPASGGIVTLDLNYWCRGNLKLLNKLPDGVTMSARRNYSQKKFAHICHYTVKLDLIKVQELELELEVVDTGDKDQAAIKPSLSPSKGRVVECLEFETDEEPSELVPCKIEKWTQMQSVMVKKGQKINIKCKFAKPGAAK